MSNTAIKLKKSSVVGKAPLVGDLAYGELAINYADGKLYYKNSSNQIKSFVDSDLVSTLVNNEINNLTLLDSDAVERISRTEIEDYLGGNIATDLIPDSNESYDLGSPTKRFKELYLSGNTINIGGATISSDGTGQIQISGSGAILPAGSKIQTTDSAEDQIAIVGQDGVVVRRVDFFTNAGGLSTPATQFNFRANDEARVFTGFTFNNGSSLGQIETEVQFLF